MINETNPIERVVKEFQSGVNVEDNYTLIYDSLRPVVLRYFNSKDKSTKNKSDELTQETLIRVYKGLGRFEGKCSLVGWAISIAHNVWVSDLRARTGEGLQISLDTAGDNDDQSQPRIALVDSGPDPLKAALRNDLEKAILRLPRQEQNCIKLRYGGDLSIKEIAIILGIKEGTVKAHLNHGLVKLRDYLQDDDHNK